jgi:hypothetical protein
MESRTFPSFSIPPPLHPHFWNEHGAQFTTMEAKMGRISKTLPEAKAQTSDHVIPGKLSFPFDLNTMKNIKKRQKWNGNILM